MSAHRQQRDSSLGDWRDNPNPSATAPSNDPGPGGFITGDTILNMELVIGSGSEAQMTLFNPLRAGITLTFTVQSSGGGSRAIRVSGGTKINVTGNNTITFSTVDHTVQLYSVRYAGASNASPSGFRWEIVFNDGPSLSTT